MTDKQLSILGEKLYSAVLAAHLSPPALADLARAILARRPWAELGPRTKISTFVVAASLSGCAREPADIPSPADAGFPPHPVDAGGELPFDDLTPTPDLSPTRGTEPPASSDDRPPVADLHPAASSSSDDLGAVPAVALDASGEEIAAESDDASSEPTDPGSRALTNSLDGPAA
jgi:hypothetical protein